VDGRITASLKGAWLSHVIHLNFGGHNQRLIVSGAVNLVRRWVS